MVTMGRWFRAGAIAAWVVSGCTSAAVEAAAQTITWHDSFAAALSAAKESARPILAEVSCGGCPDCKTVCDKAREQLRQMYADPRVAESFKHFECARAKAQKGRRGQQTQRFQQFEALMTPVVLLLSPDGRSELARFGWLAASDAFVGTMGVVAGLDTAFAALKADPKDPDALADIGHACVGLERYDQAQEYLRKALGSKAEFDGREDAELDAAICGVLTARSLAQRPAKTPPWLHDMETFLNTHPNSPRSGEALFYLSTAHLNAGQTEDAESGLERVIAREPSDSRWRQLAEQTLPTIQLPRLQAEVVQRPGDANVNYGVGHALVTIGKFGEAIRYLSRAIALDPDGALGCREDATLELAICYCWVDQSGGLRLQHFLRKYPESPRVPEARYRLASWAYALGNSSTALEVAEELIQLHPDGIWARRAQALADRIKAQDGGPGR